MPAPPLSLAWIATPKQLRSQKRLARILDAAESVIGQKGFEQASIAEIMARAGSGVGTFYDRFRSKDDLLRCLLARFTEQSRATSDEVLDMARWRSRSLAEIVAAVVPFLLSVYRQRRGLIRAFLLRGSVDLEFNQAAHEAEIHAAGRLSELLLDHAREMDHPRPAECVTMTYQMLRAMLNSLTLFELRRRAGYTLDDPRLEAELTRAVLRLLAVRNSPTEVVTPASRRNSGRTAKTARKRPAARKTKVTR